MKISSVPSPSAVCPTKMCIRHSVGAGHIDLGPQGTAAVREFARPHPAEKIQVFLGGAVPIGAGGAGLAGVIAPASLHLLPAQVAHIGLAFPDQLLGVFIADLKIVAAVKDTPVGDGAQPGQVLICLLYTSRCV